jgi:cobyrinic acid a,c-diamide synthase
MLDIRLSSIRNRVSSILYLTDYFKIDCKMNQGNYPRIVIGGLSGDSGKTVITCGILTCFRDKGINVNCFKKGPDYIDAAWLSLASGKPARNLDTYMMGFNQVKKSFIKNADKNGINIIEGNRGIFDGVDCKGTHSTAELAKLFKSPVIIIQNIFKVTRTAAAFIKGCMAIDPDLKIAGVILNQVAGNRHSSIAKTAIEEETGIPVLGTIPKLSEKYILPSRHLGLILPEELEKKNIIMQNLKNTVEDNVDVSKILQVAYNADSLEDEETKDSEKEPKVNSDKVKIGYFKDKSFSFYYPENLEMLSEAGADLVPISPTNKIQSTQNLDDIDALYIGGGFPEMNLPELVSNNEMIDKIKILAENGLPIYAECGGLMYLAKKITWKGNEYKLSGILPIEIQMHNKPQGHGYCEAVVDNENSFYKTGTVIKGHEFHYSKINSYEPGIKSVLSVSRGTGCFENRDGINYKNVFAGYIHIHAIATPEWVDGMINSAKNYKNFKKNIPELMG